MNLTILFFILLTILLITYIFMLKEQISGLLKSYKYYCKGFCPYSKMCRKLEDFPNGSSIDALKVIEHALNFYANSTLLRDMQQTGMSEFKVIYNNLDGITKSITYHYNAEPAKVALELLHAITSTQPDTVLEVTKNRIITGINTSLYQDILSVLQEIDKIALFIASSECKHRRREAQKITKLLKMITDIKEEII